MKKLAILFLCAAAAMIGSSYASAQGKYGADSAECIKYLSYYQDYYKQKNYNDAIPNWRKAFHLCPPTANQNMLLNGAILMRRLIDENESNPTYRSELIDTLLLIHDLRAQTYPKYTVTAINNKGLDIINYVKDNDQFVYDELNKVVQANGVETNPNLLVVLMNSTVALYNAGSIADVDVFNKYQESMELLEEIGKVKTDEDINKYSSAIENLLITSSVADCDKLVELFTPRLAADPDSYETAATIVRILSITEGGVNTDLFVDAASAMHRLQPTASSAYFMYRVYSSRGDLDNAMAMIDQACSFEDVSDDQKGQYCYELSVNLMVAQKTSKAYEYASKGAMLTSDANTRGKCYIICGTVWGSIVCPGNEIESRAPYWVAVDYMNRAKAADPDLAEECNRNIAQYSKYFPQTADAFMYDITDGQSYTVSCGGISATTTVKTQK